MMNYLNIRGKNIFVYRLCDMDAVAAQSLNEAVEFYKEETGLKNEDLYDFNDIEEMDMNSKFYYDESKENKVKLIEIVKEQKAFPCVVLTWDY